MIVSSPSSFHGLCPNNRAFTLVELIAAMAVLSLLVVMLAQVVALTSQAITLNTQRLNASSQARIFFDRLGTDLEARPRRTDLGLSFTKATGNDSFQFYSQVNGYSGTRHVAAVGYRIQQTTAGRIFQLERGATGTDWASGTGNNPLSFLPQALTPPNNSDYEVLSNSIFRLEFCYLLTTGSLSNSANSDFSNVAAIVVAVGALDSTKRQILSNAQLQTVSSALPDDTEGQDPISGWNTAMGQSTFAAGLPVEAIQIVHIYQRIFYVQ